MTSLPSHAPDAALDDQALDWFVRRRAGLDAAGESGLQAWLAASPMHATALRRWQADWDGLDTLPAAGVALLRSQLACDLAAERARSTPRRRGWLQPAMAAASLVLVVGGAWLAVDTWQQQPLFAQSFATQRGQRMEFTLPDGSQMQLDTSTRSDVALYRDHREVRLPQGQAEFHVARDAARPFDVLAGPLRITVLGTRFAVRYTPVDASDGQVSVAVEEGHVRVAPADGAAAAVELHAGEQVRSDAAGHLGAVAHVAPDGIAPWRDGRLSFEDATLAQVLAELERYGSTGLVLGDARVGQLRLTGTFDPRRPENFRRVLPQVMPVRLLPRGDHVEIVAAR